MTIIDMDKMGEALNTKADIDLNNTGVFSTSEGGVVNLTSSTPANASGKEVTSADFFQSNLLNYTTNRILEIPQDIKLELNNGTLTLKSGSKVYVPNGVGTFNAVTIASDVSTVRTDNQDCIAWYNTDTGTIQVFPSILFYSGTTAPSEYTFMFWYDITNNKCKVTSDSGSTWVEGKSFPICVVSTDGTKISAIKQIFNGFGYIGSTVFALPGIKFQTPNGKNADGTYKSVIRTIDSVRTFDAGAFGTKNLKLIVSSGSLIFQAQPEERFTYNKQFSSDMHTLSYDENTGYWWYSSDRSSWVKDFVNILGSVTVTSGKITSFEPYTVDSVVNSNEFYQLRDKAVTTDTAQTITGVKEFNNGSGNVRTNIDIVTNDGVGDDANNKWAGSIQFKKGNVNVGFCEALKNSSNTAMAQLVACNSVNGQNIFASMRIAVTSGGYAVASAPTPSASATGDEIATAGWVNSKIQLVNELPANPVAGVLYCIPEA